MLDSIIEKGERLRVKLDSCIEALHDDETLFDSIPRSLKLSKNELYGWYETVWRIINDLDEPNGTYCTRRSELKKQYDAAFDPTRKNYPNTISKQLSIDLDYVYSLLYLLQELKIHLDYLQLTPKSPVTKQSQGEKMDDEDVEVFQVFLSHGRSKIWQEVSRYIEKQLHIDTVELEEQPNQGKTIIEKLESAVNDCHFAIVIMTAEDEQASGTFRTRQNVIHEIGYLQGALGREHVLVLKENGVEEFTNISGIVYEPFARDTIRTAYDRVRREIDLSREAWEKEGES